MGGQGGRGCLYEVAISHGHGGSLLKDMKLLKCKQKLKADAVLVAQDSL